MILVVFVGFVLSLVSSLAALAFEKKSILFVETVEAGYQLGSRAVTRFHSPRDCPGQLSTYQTSYLCLKQCHFQPPTIARIFDHEFSRSGPRA